MGEDRPMDRLNVLQGGYSEAADQELDIRLVEDAGRANLHREQVFCGSAGDNEVGRVVDDGRPGIRPRGWPRRGAHGVIEPVQRQTLLASYLPGSLQNVGAAVD